jgi:hypothetical protein
MIASFSHFFVVVLLMMPGQQESGQLAPSVEDAARAARERQKSSHAKHVVSDDDLTSGRGRADSAGNEAQVRSDMEKFYPANPTAADLKSQMDQLRIDAKYSIPEFLAKSKDVALHGYENVDFPGKKEWEEQLAIAVNHFVNDAAEAASRIEFILDQNQDVLSRRDAADALNVRAQWINAMVPHASWQARMQQLIDDGQVRAKGYLSDSAVGLGDYRSAHTKQTEAIVGWTLYSLQQAELDFKAKHGHYTCELASFNSDVNWRSNAESVAYWGYRILMKSCDDEHYTAMAVPPTADGSQGRTFCTSESGGVHIADGKDSANCLSSPLEWQKQ